MQVPQPLLGGLTTDEDVAADACELVLKESARLEADGGGHIASGVRTCETLRAGYTRDHRRYCGEDCQSRDIAASHSILQFVELKPSRFIVIYSSTLNRDSS
jgi:hypothetical protein